MNDELNTEAAADERVPAEYTFTAGRLPRALQAIDKANRRLARAGGAERFTFSHVERLVATVETLPGGAQRTTQRAVVTLTVNAPQIAVGDWVFVATLIHEQGAVISRTAPDQVLGQTAVSVDPICDHCQTRRARRDTYVLRHRSTGQTMQVGSSCLVPFLGVRPAGLWALQYDLNTEIGEGDDEAGGFGGGRGDLRVPVKDVLAIALVLSELGKTYVSRSRAQLDERLTPTADQVLDVLFGSGGDQDARRWRAETLRDAQLLDQAVVDEVMATGRGLSDDGDYARNVRTVVDLDLVDHRNIPLIASLVGVHYRELQRRAERLSWTSGFLAAPGVKLSDVDAVVTTVKAFPGYYGTTTLFVLQTTDGHAVKWMAAGAKTGLADVGDRVLVRGTVKACETWQEVDQTVLTRARIMRVAG